MLDGIVDIYVLEENDKFIVEVTVVYHSKMAGYTVLNKRVYLEGFRVHEDYQGQGISQTFLLKLFELLKQEGYKEITIGVEDDNEVAKHIYHKLGFDIFLRRDRDHFEDEYYDYDVWMKLL